MKNLYCYITLAICLLSVTVQGTSSSNYRLPHSVHPEHYRVEILTHLNDNDQGFTYYGKVWIKVSVCVQLVRILFTCVAVSLTQLFKNCMRTGFREY